MAKKKVEKQLKALKKKHGKLKEYVKHLEKQLQELATPPGPSESIKKKVAKKKTASKEEPATAKVEKSDVKPV